MKSCGNCGLPFRVVGRNQKYCNKVCAKRARKKQRRERYLRGQKHFKKADCKCCGGLFQKKYANHKYCSDYCREEVKKEIQRIANHKYRDRKMRAKKKYYDQWGKFLFEW